jgi:UDP-glucuronate 4-epimerase
LAIHKFSKLIEQDKPIPVYGDGSMIRDFTYIDDIIDGMIAAMNKCEGFNIYNLGESEPITVNDLIGAIEKALDKTAIREYLPLQPGDVNRTFVDITKTARELGFYPSTPIPDGLVKFAAWLRKE